MKYLSVIISILYTYILSRYSNVDIEKKTIVHYRSKISCAKGSIEIGCNTSIGRNRKGYHASMPFYTTMLVDKENAQIKIGNNCRINGAYIHAQNNIEIGDNCVFASGINIIDSNGHEVNSLDRTTGRDIPQPITIGNNVWIGINATILKGTTIGDNSIVTAGSVVKGVFPSNSIIQGNPAIVVGEIKI